MMSDAIMPDGPPPPVSMQPDPTTDASLSESIDPLNDSPPRSTTGRCAGTTGSAGSPSTRGAVPRERIGLSAGAGVVVVLAAAELMGQILEGVLPQPWREHLSMTALIALPLLGAVLAFPLCRRVLAGRRDSNNPGTRCFWLGCGAAVFALTAWHGSVMCWSDMTQSMRTDPLKISTWMVAMWIPFLSVALLIRQLLALLRLRA